MFSPLFFQLLQRFRSYYFMPLIYFEQILVYSERQGSAFSLVESQNFQSHFLKKTVLFPNAFSWNLPQESVGHRCMYFQILCSSPVIGLSGFMPTPYCSDCSFVVYLKSASVMSLTLCLLIKTVSSILVFLWSHTRFSSGFSLVL